MKCDPIPSGTLFSKQLLPREELKKRYLLSKIAAATKEGIKDQVSLILKCLLTILALDFANERWETCKRTTKLPQVGS